MWNRRAGMGLAALVMMVAVNGVDAQAPEPEVNVWTGVYTSEQADRGKKVYGDMCRSCHLDTLMGGGQTPGLVGEGFVSAWDTLTVRDLYSRLRTTMPADRPGSLGEQ